VTLVARAAPGVELRDMGEDVLAFDGSTLTLLSGTEVAVVRAADGIRPVRDTEVVRSLETRGLLVLTEPAAADRFRRPDDIGFCEDEGHLVLLDLRTGLQHVLSESASQIWLLVTRTGSVEQAITQLEATHPEATEVPGDVAMFVDQLVASRLLELVPPDG
jgi:hypothetical protein